MVQDRWFLFLLLIFLAITSGFRSQLDGNVEILKMKFKTKTHCTVWEDGVISLRQQSLIFNCWNLETSGGNGNYAEQIWEVEGVEQKFPKFESRQFSYNDLNRITDNLEKKIGTGAFGEVYLGILEDGVQVAVKMYNQSSTQAVKQFLAEEGDLYWKLRDRKNPFSWRQRLQIAYESALGLEYLHKTCNPPLIHRDVKTSNILLTASLQAKIADFGLSMVFNNTAINYVFEILGTVGYIDPEYRSTGKLTLKGDVFGFGVVLLEIITGKPPINVDQEGIELVQWVRQKLSGGNIESIVDSKMKGKYDLNSIQKITNLACKCTEHRTSERPTMTEVAAELKESLDLEVLIEEMYCKSTDNLITDVSQGTT